MNPYTNLPKTSFWSAAVAKSATTVPQNLYKKKWSIDKKDQIATAGSCFAQHIGRHLRENAYRVMDVEPPPQGLLITDQKRFGFSIYSARYGNIYTVRQLLQLAKEAFSEWLPGEIVWEGKNGRYYDAFRPGVEPDGLGSPEEVLAHRAYHLGRVRELFEKMDLFIFTLGLTEAWMHKESGTVFPTAPGTIAGTFDPSRYKFKNFLFEEVRHDFNTFKKIIHEKQIKKNKCKFILTVSPVPLTATASDKHVMLATTYSKSVLRAVAGQLSMHQHDIDYFPSYEIVSNPWSDYQFFEENLRSVRESGVNAVMQAFFLEHEGLVNNENLLLRSSSSEKVSEPDEDFENLVCEEAILDAFSR
ncbi:GSCFA domain protein [Thiorhodococcus drewsii AZ1]|uniref:GSCFA domain protein n=1 Tax=Thiorhodococcus drewsii AZ1 TaxID=765913 RepID=G2E5X8_9GAMM|nr:GSCFA domain-containing protein [Thiorhodococcus drewsii]EGV28541.1 GSCFA domain protein [Thiorhodococcus drewsii AZ1]